MRYWRSRRSQPAAPLTLPTAPPGGFPQGATVPVAQSFDGLLPQALGLETKGGVFTALIAHGTPLPARRSEIFTTADDNQTSITITMLQGHNPQAARNTKLGVFELTGIAPQPRGQAQIEVDFAVDATALTVSAMDIRTGSALPVTVTGTATPGPA